MIALVQRVAEARVAAGGENLGAIGRGVLALVGVERADMQVSLVNDGPVTFWLQVSPSTRS